MSKPKRKQRSVSLPEWVMKVAEDYIKENENELKHHNVDNPTALIRYLILQADLKDKRKHE